MTYAEVLQELLDEKDVKPAELAKRIGKNRSTIGTILKGKNEPRLRTAKAIADALEVDLDYFLDRMDL